MEQHQDTVNGVKWVRSLWRGSFALLCWNPIQMFHSEHMSSKSCYTFVASIARWKLNTPFYLIIAWICHVVWMRNVPCNLSLMNLNIGLYFWLCLGGYRILRTMILWKGGSHWEWALGAYSLIHCLSVHPVCILGIIVMWSLSFLLSCPPLP